MRITGTRLAGALCALTLSIAAQAAPPSGGAADPANEPVTVHVEAVNVASRQFIADGQTWALSSTARFHVPGKKRGSLGDISVGESVLLELEPDSNGQYPVVRSLTVLPD